MDAHRTVILLPWQSQVWEDSHRYKVINCGRRAGKSSVSALRKTDFAIKNEQSIVWYVAPTYKQAKNIMWEMLKFYVPEAAVERRNETELKIDLKNGSSIHLKGADNPDSLRGVRIDLIIFDEVAFIDKWGEVWKILRPTLMDSQAEAWFISTPNGFNHFYVLSQMHKTDPDWAYFHFTTFDNPHIPSEEIEKSRKEMTEDAFAQEMLGDFKKAEGTVYKQFDLDVHVQELPDFQPLFWIRGCDRGYTNPTAVPYIQVDRDGNWYQVDEIYETGLTNTKFSQRLKEMDEKWGIQEYELSTMDSAQAGDIKELQEMGHDFLPVKKEAGETNAEFVRWKIQRFSQRLEHSKRSKPKYIVHPRCKATIFEFQKYSYKDQGRDDEIGDEWNLNPMSVEENRDENPQKAYDHIMDALGDLNAMYLHYVQPQTSKPDWVDKPKGTYVPPSPGNDTWEDANDFINAPGMDW